MKTPITETVVTAYLETLLWSETFHGQGDEGDEPLTWEGSEYEPGTTLDSIVDVSDLPELAPEVIEEAHEDLEDFRQACLLDPDVGLDPFKFFDPCQVAHDFALSRNGHGAGFFDGCYLVTAQGPEEARQSEDRKTELSADLQAVARDEGTYGLTLWAEGEGDDAVLKLESHG